MIVFDLRCSAAHVFEAWFASSAAYEDQRARQLVRCPVCDCAAVTKAVMAPNVATKGNAAAGRGPDAKTVLAALAKAQAAMLAQSEWVGADFPDRARAMHDGEAPEAPIHGQASAEEVKALVDDGVPVVPLPLPVVPPTLSN